MPDVMRATEAVVNKATILRPETESKKIVTPLIEPHRITELMPVLAPALSAYPFLSRERGILERLYNYHPATYNHSLRTGVGLYLLAEELGLSESEASLLIASGLGHDGGKTRTSREILDWKGPLGERRPEMEEHLEASVRLIPDEHQKLRTIVAGHHIADGYAQYEHLWKTIDPREAMFQLLVSTVERSDAVMTKERNYRQPATKQEALGMLLEKEFDTRFFKYGLDPHLLGKIIDIQGSVLDKYPPIVNLGLPA